jgi:hypothetical protein
MTNKNKQFRRRNMIRKSSQGYENIIGKLFELFKVNGAKRSVLLAGAGRKKLQPEAVLFLFVQTENLVWKGLSWK